MNCGNELERLISHNEGYILDENRSPGVYEKGKKIGNVNWESEKEKEYITGKR